MCGAIGKMMMMMMIMMMMMMMMMLMMMMMMMMMIMMMMMMLMMMMMVMVMVMMMVLSRAILGDSSQWGKDCRMLEKYLEMVVAHPVSSQSRSRRRRRRRSRRLFDDPSPRCWVGPPSWEPSWSPPPPQPGQTS